MANASSIGLRFGGAPLGGRYASSQPCASVSFLTLFLTGAEVVHHHDLSYSKGRLRRPPTHAPKPPLLRLRPPPPGTSPFLRWSCRKRRGDVRSPAKLRGNSTNTFSPKRVGVRCKKRDVGVHLAHEHRPPGMWPVPATVALQAASLSHPSLRAGCTASTPHPPVCFPAESSIGELLRRWSPCAHPEPQLKPSLETSTRTHVSALKVRSSLDLALPLFHGGRSATIH
jgi:hypothetical protein